MYSKADSLPAKPLDRAVPELEPGPGPGPGLGGGKGPNSYVPKPRFEYKAPSILAEHKVLAILFVLVILAATVYLVRAPRKPYAIKPAPPPPVYIEAIPERPAPATR
jgi:hypothetical protein